MLKMIKDYELVSQSIVLDVTYALTTLKKTADDIFDSLYFIAGFYKDCRIQAMIRNNKLIIDVEGGERDVVNLTHDILTFPTLGY
jgi:hypothetical protein